MLVVRAQRHSISTQYTQLYIYDKRCCALKSTFNIINAILSVHKTHISLMQYFFNSRLSSERASNISRKIKSTLFASFSAFTCEHNLLFEGECDSIFLRGGNSRFSGIHTKYHTFGNSFVFGFYCCLCHRRKSRTELTRSKSNCANRGVM